MRNILLILILFFAQCSLHREPAPFPYGKEINEQRKKAGLWIIDSTFKYHHYQSTYDDINKIFYSPRIKLRKNVGKDYKLKTPTFWSKRVHLDEKTGEILAEDDTYRTGFFKSGIDVDIFEELIHRHVYKDFNYYNTYKFKEEFFKKGDYYIYKTAVPVNSTGDIKTFYAAEFKIITEQQADSIFQKWKLQRFNY